MIRCLVADLDVALRLKYVQFINHFQNDVGYLADPVGSVPFQSTKIDVRKVVIGPAFFGSNPDLWRRRMIVELDPETAEQFFGFLPVKCPVGNSFFIKRCQVLIQMAWVHDIPSVEFRDGAQVDEPVHLQSLPKIPWSMLHHPAADQGNI